MLNDISEVPTSLLEAANQNMAISGAAAIETLVEPVAKLWCRSFGISDSKIIERLKADIEHAGHDALISGKSFDRVQAALDASAETIIRDWFSYVLARDIPASGKYLAVLRLAFLDCNFENKWTPFFLKRDFIVQELSAELQSVMIMPTPQANPRAMVRQAI